MASEWSGLYIGPAEEEEIKLHPFMAWLIWEFKKTTTAEPMGGDPQFQSAEIALQPSY